MVLKRRVFINIEGQRGHKPRTGGNQILLAITDAKAIDKSNPHPNSAGTIRYVVCRLSTRLVLQSIEDDDTSMLQVLTVSTLSVLVPKTRFFFAKNG